MGISGTGAHFRGNPYRFHDFFRRCPLPSGSFGMAADAIRALGDVGDRHRDELLGLGGQGTLGENLLAKRLLENPVDGTDARKRNIPIRSLKLVERTQEEDDDGYAALSCL